MINGFEIIVLIEDLPSLNLKNGDVGTVVLVYNEGEAFEVEFIALDGKTIAVETVKTSQLRAINSNDMMHVRNLKSA